MSKSKKPSIFTAEGRSALRKSLEPANEDAKKLKPGDYIAEGGAGAIWIDISGVVVHLFESIEGRLIVEIHEPGGACDPEDAIAMCGVVAR